MLVLSLGGEDALEEGTATHSSTLDWRIPHGQRSLAGYSPWGGKKTQLKWLITHIHSRTIQLLRQGNLVGYSPQSRKESDTTEAT